MKPAGDRVIEFFYDFISPNVYLVWTQLEALAERYDYRIQPVPVLFAGFLKKYGQLGPAEVLPKNEWMVRNNLRKAALLGVPLNPPPYHPFNPLLALRVACLPGLDQHCLIGHVLRAVWVDRQYISDPGVFERVLSEAGFDGARLIELAGLAAAREALKRHTDDAINRGVFGVPTMGVGDELFWGYDDLNFLERTLAGQDLLDRERFREWMRSVTPSVTRNR